MTDLIRHTAHGRRLLGRLPARPSSHVPRYLMGGVHPDPRPAKIDYADACPADLGMMLNGEDPANPGALELGDCTCAADAHMIQVWTANTSTMLTPPNASVLGLYKGACGYVEGDPDTDNGGNEVDVLTYLVRTGMILPSGTHKLLGFYGLDVGNHEAIKQAIYECGCVYMGVDLPQAWENCMPGGLLDVTTSGAVGGHAGILTGYDDDAETFNGVWWGMKWRVTAAGLRQALEEAYAPVSADWIEHTGLSPANRSAEQIESDMTALRQAVTLVA